jgi:hypothetical protein
MTSHSEPTCRCPTGPARGARRRTGPMRVVGLQQHPYAEVGTPTRRPCRAAERPPRRPPRRLCSVPPPPGKTRTKGPQVPGQLQEFADLREHGSSSPGAATRAYPARPRTSTPAALNSATTSARWRGVDTGVDGLLRVGAQLDAVVAVRDGEVQWRTSATGRLPGTPRVEKASFIGPRGVPFPQPLRPAGGLAMMPKSWACKGEACGWVSKCSTTTGDSFAHCGAG